MAGRLRGCSCRLSPLDNGMWRSDDGLVDRFFGQQVRLAEPDADASSHGASITQLPRGKRDRKVPAESLRLHEE